MGFANNIQKWSLLYALLRLWVRFFFKLTFKSITIEGIENVNNNGANILAPNHQNALTDALAIVCTLPQQPVFLARADIFKKKWIAAILKFFKIMPVYRIRDGKDNLTLNKDVFAAVLKVLENNKTLCLFPEAAHIGMKSMLPHKKAIPRIAFMAADELGDRVPVSVVPVGIYYSHYYKFRSNLVVRYGEPIPLNPYYELYKNEGELKATSVLRNKIFDSLANQCVHVPEKDLYTCYEQTFEIYRKSVCQKLNLQFSNLNYVFAEKYIIDKLHPIIEQCKRNLSVFEEYSAVKKLLKIEESLFEDKKFENKMKVKILLSVLVFPIFLFNYVVQGWLFYLIFIRLRKMIKDPQFYNSFSFVVALIVFPFWWIMLLLLVTLILKSWLYSVLSLILLIFGGIIAWDIYVVISWWSKKFSFRKLKREKDPSFLRLMELRRKIDEIVSPLIL
jgi:1-acyl-sn-glycerol-3-phosphate acyltransferase